MLSKKFEIVQVENTELLAAIATDDLSRIT
jgi:hypothetical protein